MQRLSDDCETRLTNLIFLMMGIFQSRSGQLNLIVSRTSGSLLAGRRSQALVSGDQPA